MVRIVRSAAKSGSASASGRTPPGPPTSPGRRARAGPGPGARRGPGGARGASSRRGELRRRPRIGASRGRALSGGRCRSRGRGRLRRPQIDQETRRAVGRLRLPDPERVEGRAELDGQAGQVRVDLDAPDDLPAPGRQAHDVDGVGLESNPQPARLLDDAMRGARRRLDAQAPGARARPVAHGHAGNVDVADQDEARPRPDFHAPVGERRQGPVDEVERHPPPPVDPPGRRGERDEASAHRDERLPIGQQHLLRSRAERQRAAGGALPEVEVEPIREDSKGNQASSVHLDRLERLPRAGGDERHRRGRRLRRGRAAGKPGGRAGRVRMQRGTAGNRERSMAGTPVSNCSIRRAAGRSWRPASVPSAAGSRRDGTLGRGVAPCARDRPEIGG